MNTTKVQVAKFHLPGLFEFYEFYKVFLPLFKAHREFFYEWVEIASIYGAPSDCIWAGGRFEYCEKENAEEILDLLREYEISARLTFSNSLLTNEHMTDEKCNKLCRVFSKEDAVRNGVILHSDILLEYIKREYPALYLVSSTTKVLTAFDEFLAELRREDFSYVVPDFRINKQLEKLRSLQQDEKDKVEFLINECCDIGCKDRRACYENVSRRMLGQDCKEHICKSPEGERGYVFSKAMENPAFLSIEDIQHVYLPNGFSNFKIEGRSLGSAVVLEMLLYYMVKPKYQLKVREAIYLDSMLDLF